MKRRRSRAGEEEKDAERPRKKLMLPTLKTMNFDLEQAMNHPGKALL